MSTRVYRALFPFCGLGAGALGFLQATNPKAKFEIIGGIDFDEVACRDFEYLTGAPAWCVDVNEISPEQLRERYGAAPDVVFLSPPCLPSDGLVLTPEGPRRIETMRANDMVLTHRGRYRRVLKVGRHVYQGAMYRLRLRGTVDVQEFTAEHPMLVRRITRPVIDGTQHKRVVGKAKFIPASEVRINDYIGFPVDQEQAGCALGFVRSFGDPTLIQKGGFRTGRYTKPLHTAKVNRVIDLTPHANSAYLWFLFGVYLGDGYRRVDRAHNEAIFCVGDQASSLATHVRNALTYLGLGWTEDVSAGPTNIKIRANSRHLCMLLSAFGDGGENKRIPTQLFGLEEPLLRALLSGYHSADGCEITGPTGRSGVVGTYRKIASTSLQLLRDTQRAFLRLGQFWGLHVSVKGGDTQQIEGRSFVVRARWEIQYREDPRKKGAAFFENGMVWTKVRSVETRDANEPVWNMEVEEDNTFCTPLMATHNCKGVSGLLGSKDAESEKYQRMNWLAYTWIAKMLAAWGDQRPPLVLFENVPRITSRADDMLTEVKELLKAAGYLLQEGVHDCGVIGGLAQHRRRYLMVARHKSVQHLLYHPPTRKVRGCGEELSKLPLPGDPSAGPMHQLPNISWLNAIRLALIPAGGDWRDLPKAKPKDQPKTSSKPKNSPDLSKDKRLAILGSCSVLPDYSPTVASRIEFRHRRSNSAALDRISPNATAFHGSYGVQSWTTPSHTVTGGAAVSTGSFSVSDPRIPLGYKSRSGTLSITSWASPSRTITGQSGRAGHCSGGIVVDPRIPLGCSPRSGVYGVIGWNKSSFTVTGSASMDNGPFIVADPRIPWIHVEYAFDHGYRPLRWTDPSPTVAGKSSVGCGAYAVAEGRYNDKISKDAPGCGFEVMTWLEAFATLEWMPVEAKVKRSPKGQRSAPKSVKHSAWVDPTKPRPVPTIIIAEDGTWHRPLTTLELAVLQGLPAKVNGKPLQLGGSSQEQREHIGNAVPVGTARQIAKQMLKTLVASEDGDVFLSSDQIWVAPKPSSIDTIPRLEMSRSLADA